MSASQPSEFVAQILDEIEKSGYRSLPVDFDIIEHVLHRYADRVGDDWETISHQNMSSLRKYLTFRISGEEVGILTNLFLEYRFAHPLAIAQFAASWKDLDLFRKAVSMFSTSEEYLTEYNSFVVSLLARNFRDGPGRTMASLYPLLFEDEEFIVDGWNIRDLPGLYNGAYGMTRKIFVEIGVSCGRENFESVVPNTLVKAAR